MFSTLNNVIKGACVVPIRPYVGGLRNQIRMFSTRGHMCIRITRFDVSVFGLQNSPHGFHSEAGHNYPLVVSSTIAYTVLRSTRSMAALLMWGVPGLMESHSPTGHILAPQANRSGSRDCRSNIRCWEHTRKYVITHSSARNFGLQT
jgi:hypothetical protein